MNNKLIEKFQREEINSEDRTDRHFSNFFQYMMSIIGFTVGFGSFWRFPYYVYKHGGAVFILCYLIAIAFIGIPLFYLENALGQLHQKSGPLIFAQINKGLKMLGITYVLCCYHIGNYNNMILVYSYRFLFSSLKVPLPYSN